MIIVFNASAQGDEQNSASFGEKRFKRRWGLEDVECPCFCEKVTTIHYIARGVASAELFIVNQKGEKILKYVPVDGEGKIEIPAGTLSPGNYSAVLIVNSRMVGRSKFNISGTGI